MLYVGGLVLDTVWPGTILPFYGAMFVVAAALFAALDLGPGCRPGAALVAAGLNWWQVQSSLDSDDTSWFFAPSSSVLDRLADVTINGTHPLLPWLAFLCTGIVLGRQLRTDWWRPVALGVGCAFRRCSLVSSSIASGPLATPLSSTDPFDAACSTRRARSGPP